MGTKLVFVSLSLCLAPEIVAGTIAVYDNGAPNLQNGNEITFTIQAEDFVLSADTLITAVRFWSIEDPNFAGYAGSIWYGIYTDNSGQPNLGVPGVEGFLPGTDLVRTYTGNTIISPGLYNEYEYSFGIQPIVALAGVRYWLGLHNGSLANTNSVSFLWETTNPNLSLGVAEDPLPPAGDGWFVNHTSEHAFQLTGVPEPDSLTLFGVGILGLSFARKRNVKSTLYTGSPSEF